MQAFRQQIDLMQQQRNSARRVTRTSAQMRARAPAHTHTRTHKLRSTLLRTWGFLHAVMLAKTRGVDKCLSDAEQKKLTMLQVSGGVAAVHLCAHLTAS